MALTPSTMLDIGTAAPDFSLPDWGTRGGGVGRTEEEEKKKKESRHS